MSVYSVSSGCAVVFLLLQLICADQSLMFANTMCSSEEFVTDAFLPALRLAIDDVNCKILTNSSGQQLTLCNSYDFKSNHTVHGMSPLEAIFKSLDHNPDCSNASVVIHPGCAEDSVNISAMLAKQHPNLTQITYAFSSVASIMLTHGSHVRMIPQDIHLASGLSRFVTFFNWTRVVIITQKLPTFVEISQSLQEISASVAHQKISLTEKVLNNVEDRIEFPSNHRILILNMYPAYAKAVLCEAYKKKMLFPDYVWITYGWYYDNHWWKTNDSCSKCTAEEIGVVLNGAIALSHYPASYSDSLTLNYSDLTDYYSKLVYDAVMVYGVSLNENESSGLKLIDVLKSLNTTGVSGNISFSNGFRYIQDVQLFQYRTEESSQCLEMKPVGLVPILAPAGNLTFFTNESIATLWPDGVPCDGTPREIINYSLLPLTAVCYVYATVGIFFALICLIFNIVYRNKKLIRLTSPNLNYLVIIGAIIIYSSVYTYFYIPQAPLNLVVIECSFRLWLTSFGFSLCYIPISVKMWRVYHICRKPRPSIKNLFMRDWHLMIITFIFVMVDVTILVSISAIDSARFMVAIIPDKEHPGQFIDEEGYPVVNLVRKCHSNTEPYWITPLFAYKFVLQFIGVFLAFSIRKVKIKGLNDSREVSAILYITTAILVATVLCTFAFGDYINVDGATFGTGIATSTSFVLGLLFIPKMYGLYKDPKGEKIFALPGLRKDNNTGSSSTGKTQATQVVLTNPNEAPS